MNRYYIGHSIVAALGFLAGAVFAMIIVPGDALVLIGMGVVFGFSARALFDQDFGGDWFWPFGRPAGRKALAAKPSIGHRQSSRVRKIIQEPEQRAIKQQARSVLNSCGVGPSLERLDSPEPRNVVAEEVQGDLDDIDTMISEGSPTR